MAAPVLPATADGGTTTGGGGEVEGNRFSTVGGGSGEAGAVGVGDDPICAASAAEVHGRRRLLLPGAAQDREREGDEHGQQVKERRRNGREEARGEAGEWDGLLEVARTGPWAIRSDRAMLEA